MDLKNAFPRTYNKLTSSEHNHLLAEEITQEKWSYLNSFIYLIQYQRSIVSAISWRIQHTGDAGDGDP
jgi:hypothetical protein